MAVWICDSCMFSREGPYWKRATQREVGDINLPHVELCCPSCWAAFLAVDPGWDWRSEGWSYGGKERIG